MKAWFLPLVYCVSAILSGCTSTSPTSPSGSSKGSVSLRLSKVNVPQSVETVEAILSRTGYDSLTASMNIQTDTSATLQLDNIPVGLWKLTVNAMDANRNVLYSGGSDANILAGVTTQVSLTLMPVGSQTGGISITVNWGITLPQFADYVSNPVFTANDNPSNPAGVAFERIILDGSTYRMWYMATYPSQRPSIWYAQSADGIDWTAEGSQPVLTTNDPAMWDYNGFFGGGGVIKDGDIFRMYYNVTSNGVNKVGLATSTDGENWTKNPSPVLSPDSSEQYHIGAQSAVKVNGTYYLYYDSYPINQTSSWTINVATSSDGVNFTKYSGNPILTATLAWEGSGVATPTVIFDTTQFVMMYENAARGTFGIAYSPDGLNWMKPSSQPVFSVSNANRNFVGIDYGFLMKVISGYRLYYTSQNTSNVLSISFASSPNIR